MKERRAVKFISRYSPALASPVAFAKNAPARSIKVCLCLSVLLGVLDVRREKQLAIVAWSSLTACRHNSIHIPDFTNLLEPLRSSGYSWVLLAFEWVIANSSSLRSQGVGLILDSLLGARECDVPKIIHLLTKIRSLNIGLYFFDQAEQLINMGETGDIVSSDDYIAIWVRSEVARTLPGSCIHRLL